MSAVAGVQEARAALVALLEAVGAGTVQAPADVVVRLRGLVSMLDTALGRRNMEINGMAEAADAPECAVCEATEDLSELASGLWCCRGCAERAVEWLAAQRDDDEAE